VHVRSDAHFVRHVLATQISVVSVQSESFEHATHRPLAASQTSVFGQSSEFLHVTYGMHFRAVQSFIAGQSAAVTHSTHMAIDGSQIRDAGQSRLFRQPGEGGPPSSPACLLPLPQLADHPASATTAAAMVRKRLEA